MDDLIALAERCEAATGADRALGREVLLASGMGYVSPLYGWLDPTVSIDAAMSLVPEGMIVLITNTGISGRGADLSLAAANVGFPDKPENDPSEARSMALALTAASLRARAAALKLEG